MATLNRYHIAVTLEISVEVEAFDEQGADDKVSAAVFEEGYGDASIVACRITETFIDGPAKYEAYTKAVTAFIEASRTYGKDSPEAAAADAAIPKDAGI